MAIRKAAMVLTVPALLAALSGTAQAEPAAFDDCPAGYACFWTGPDDTGSRCAWAEASTQHADLCSWAATTNVRSVYNHGVSTAYSGLCFYRLPNYDKSLGSWYLPQGHRENLGAGWKVLSHKWITPGEQC